MRMVFVSPYFHSLFVNVTFTHQYKESVAQHLLHRPSTAENHYRLKTKTQESVNTIKFVRATLKGKEYECQQFIELITSDPPILSNSFNTADHEIATHFVC